jgi:hypothetical protein
VGVTALCADIVGECEAIRGTCDDGCAHDGRPAGCTIVRLGSDVDFLRIHDWVLNQRDSAMNPKPGAPPCLGFVATPVPLDPCTPATGEDCAIGWWIVSPVPQNGDNPIDAMDAEEARWLATSFGWGVAEVAPMDAWDTNDCDSLYPWPSLAPLDDCLDVAPTLIGRAWGSLSLEERAGLPVDVVLVLGSARWVTQPDGPMRWSSLRREDPPHDAVIESIPTPKPREPDEAPNPIAHLPADLNERTAYLLRRAAERLRQSTPFAALADDCERRAGEIEAAPDNGPGFWQGIGEGLQRENARLTAEIARLTAPASEERIAEIEGRLAKATPGPYRLLATDDMATDPSIVENGCAIVAYLGGLGVDGERVWTLVDDASATPALGPHSWGDLFAHAPQDLRLLLTDRARLIRERDERLSALRAENESWRASLVRVEEERDTLREQLAEARAALQQIGAYRDYHAAAPDLHHSLTVDIPAIVDRALAPKEPRE